MDRAGGAVQFDQGAVHMREASSLEAGSLLVRKVGRRIMTES